MPRLEAIGVLVALGASPLGRLAAQAPPPEGVRPFGQGPTAAAQRRPAATQGEVEAPPGASGDGGGGEGQGGEPREGGGDGRQRPTRSSLQGERSPASPGGRRRVVIDSQASRRQSGGPPPQQQPPRGRRRGGSRRRSRALYEAQQAAPREGERELDVIRINSGSTVKDVAEYLGVPVPDIIKKLMQLGEMATLTQTLSDEAIGVLAEEFEKKIEIVHAADDVDDDAEFVDEEGELV